MPAKIECPNCSNMTFKLARCTYCGASLDFGEDESDRARKDNERRRLVLEDQADFEEQYRIMQSDLALDKFQFGRYLKFNQLKGTPFMGIRRLSVPTGWRALVFAEHGNFEMELNPGVYPVSQKHVDANPLAGFVDSFSGASLGIFLVRNDEFTVTFIVPEYRDGSAFHDLSTCNIRSAEGFMGGVSVTMNLRIKEPLRTFYLKYMEHDEPDSASGLKAALAPLSFLKTQIFGQGRDDSDIVEFTSENLWERIRVEFVQCVRSAVLDESAEEMRSSVDVRERVKQELDDGLQATMERYGLDIVRVSAFQFLSPDHDRILTEQGEIAAESARLRQEQERARLRREQRDVNERDAIDTAETEKNIEKASTEAQAEVDLAKKDAEARIKEAEDRNLASDMDRARERDVDEQGHRREQDRLNRNHERSQIEADGRLQIDLQAEKARRYLELKNMQEDAALERRVKMMKAVSEAGLDPQSILAVHLAENPQLAGAYAAAAQAQGYEQRMKMHEQFEQKLLQMGTQDKENVNRLLHEGIRQMGAVMTASQNRNRPQILAAGGGMHQISGGQTPESEQKGRDGKQSANAGEKES